MKIALLTFPVGHLVSDIEYQRLAKGLAKVNVELYRGIPDDYDLLMVKGWSHTWAQVQELNILKKPVVYLSIGTEWKLNATPELNEPIRELYKNADAVIHISEYCRLSHEKVFHADRGEVIIPACESNLSPTLKPLGSPLRLALTSNGERPVKRIAQIQELCKIHGVDLILALGNVSDFSYYHDLDGGICLSRKEGMPNNVLEMMAYGLPCIVTNYGGAKEAVGNAGIVIQNDPEGPWDPDHIEPIDPVLFEKALLDFRNRHTELRHKVRERVRTELNDYVTACRFREVFESCV